LPFAAFDLDEGEALGAEGLGRVFQRLEFALGDVGEALGVDRLDRATTLHRAGEDLKGGLAEGFRGVDQFQSKTQVGLVDAEAVHRFVERHARDGAGQLVVGRFLPNLAHHAFEQRINVLAIDKGGLDVDLGKFHLAVGTQVLIAEAAGDLEVTLHAGDHQDRKSTRLNSSHVKSSYAVFCLKKK